MWPGEQVSGRGNRPGGHQVLGQPGKPGRAGPGKPSLPDSRRRVRAGAARDLQRRDRPAGLSADRRACGNGRKQRRAAGFRPRARHLAPELAGWRNVEIARLLEEELGAPSFLENDANACALAEWRLGAGRGTRNMVFCTMGTGFGAGLILDGRLYRGSHDLAGEIGHVRLTPDGPVGYGKAGSVEGYCGGSGIAQLARLRARQGRAAGGVDASGPTSTRSQPKRSVTRRSGETSLLSRSTARWERCWAGVSRSWWTSWTPKSS